MKRDIIKDETGRMMVLMISMIAILSIVIGFFGLVLLNDVSGNEVNIEVNKPFVTLTIEKSGNYINNYYNGNSPSNLDLIITATLSPDDTFPRIRTESFSEYQNIQYHRLVITNTDTGQIDILEWKW